MNVAINDRTSPQRHYEILVDYLEDYLEMKFIRKDWHGVCDAANDIRELLAAHPEIEE